MVANKTGPLHLTITPGASWMLVTGPPCPISTLLSPATSNNGAPLPPPPPLRHTRTLWSLLPLASRRPSAARQRTVPPWRRLQGGAGGAT